jgi:cytochrome c-type biogenesis protein CcmH
MAYADTLVRANQGSFQGRATELIHRVLSIEPGNHTALLFAGLAAEEAGNYREANEFYSKLLPVLQNRPDLSQTVNGLIARNNMLMQEEGSTTEALPGEMEAQVADPGKSVQLRISVSDEVAGNYKVGDTLFVYAQAQDGSPMPLAVVRTTVGEFPMDVTLDDSMAMMPTRKLSDFESVRIQARISKSGNAEPGSGDVVGVAEQVSVPDTAVTGIELNEILP